MSKAVNSAFHGTPDLHAWLVDRKAAGIVVCGITTAPDRQVIVS